MAGLSSYTFMIWLFKKNLQSAALRSQQAFPHLRAFTLALRAAWQAPLDDLGFSFVNSSPPTPIPMPVSSSPLSTTQNDMPAYYRSSLPAGRILTASSVPRGGT